MTEISITQKPFTIHSFTYRANIYDIFLYDRDQCHKRVNNYREKVLIFTNLRPCQTSTMEYIWEIVNDFQPLLY